MMAILRTIVNIILLVLIKLIITSDAFPVKKLFVLQLIRKSKGEV